MSGPFCETCRYYRSNMIGQGGECTDPTKIIYAGSGDRVNDEPDVMPRFECSNHKTLRTAQKEA